MTITRKSLLEKYEGQMSQSFITGLFLVLSGGFQDAYTYFYRDKVFANAQTGNVALMSWKFFQGNFKDGIKYLVPISAFILGLLASEYIRQHFKYMKKIHWRQVVLFIEILLLFIVGFIPTNLNPLANALVSFVCAIQVQSFRKIKEISCSSTMCIGNIRKATENLYKYFYYKKRQYLYKSLKYYGVVVLFAIGAGLGGIITNQLQSKAIWISCGFLIISFLIMFIKEDELEITENYP